MKPYIVMMILALCLFGCSQTPHQVVIKPEVNTRIFPINEMPAAYHLYALSSAQIDDVEQMIRELGVQDAPAYLQVKAVVELISQDFSYIERNYNASEALALSQGNCMSMALISLGLAHHLNAKINYQMIYNEPILLGIENNIALISNHVRSIVYDAPQFKHLQSNIFPGVNRVTIDFLPNNRQRSGKFISAKQLLAMFYRNLAADALVASDTLLAVELAQAGLRLDANSSSLINIMALAHKRRGDSYTATLFYEYGLALSQQNINLISNYMILAEEADDKDKLARLRSMMINTEADGYYDVYIEALDRMTQKDYQLAKQLLKKFIKHNPYFDQAYWKLAEVEYQLGSVALAKKALNQALNFTMQQDKIDLYQAKMNWLNQ